MKAASTPAVVFRLGRRPDPWSWPDWRFAGPDGTFGNRFDDPQGLYRVLYASTQRLATFVECLAPFRSDPEIIAEYAAIVASDGDDEPPSPGDVPISWIEARCVGTAELTGDYVELGHHQTLAELRRALAGRVVHYGMHELNAAAIRLTAPRAFTQEISRYVFDETINGARRWNGIAYRSKHGDDLDNWAVFEPATPATIAIESFDASDRDLDAALYLLGLHLSPPNS